MTANKQSQEDNTMILRHLFELLAALLLVLSLINIAANAITNGKVIALENIVTAALVLEPVNQE